MLTIDSPVHDKALIDVNRLILIRLYKESDGAEREIGNANKNAPNKKKIKKTLKILNDAYRLCIKAPTFVTVLFFANCMINMRFISAIIF